MNVVLSQCNPYLRQWCLFSQLQQHQWPAAMPLTTLKDSAANCIGRWSLNEAAFCHYCLKRYAAGWCTEKVLASASLAGMQACRSAGSSQYSRAKIACLRVCVWALGQAQLCCM